MKEKGYESLINKRKDKEYYKAKIYEYCTEGFDFAFFEKSARLQRNEEYFRGIQNQNHLRYFEVASGGELKMNPNINNILKTQRSGFLL